MKKLYYSDNLNPRLCVAAARYLRAPVEYEFASPRDPARSEFFRPLNPNLLVPILVEDGGSLWETDAIVCRLARLTGSSFFPEGAELPDLLRWLSWAAYDFVQNGGAIYFDRITVPKYAQHGLKHLVPETVTSHVADFHRGARLLDGVLADRDWLIGGRVTYADFRVGTVFPYVEEMQIDLSAYPHVRRLKARLEDIDVWRDPFAGL